MTRRKPKLETLEEITGDVVDAEEIKPAKRVVKKKAVAPVNRDVILPRSASRYVPELR